MKKQKNVNRNRARRLEKRLASHDALEDTIVDTLADLRHWCDMKKLDFAKLDKTAYGHYLEEL